MTALLLIAALAQARDASPAALAGRVIDAATGRPIVGAVVIPFGSATQAVPDRPRALTDAGGRFAIRGLHDGSVILIATRGGYVDATFGQTRPAGHGRPIAVHAGDKTPEISIRMWRESVITGTVTDETGDPVIGVRVQVFLGSRAGGRKRFAPGAAAITDDRGAYRIPHLLPGDYVVAVISRQTAIPSEVTDVFFSGASSRGERDELGREMKTIDAPVVPAGSHYAMNAGAVTLVLPPGTATPTSRSDGALMVYPTTFYPSASAASAAAVIALATGQERSNVDIQLPLARTARIGGALTAPADMAAHVAVRLTASGNDAVAGGVDAATTITDNTGAFTLVGVPPGDYVLSVVRAPRPPREVGDSGPMKIVTGAVTIVPRVAPPPDAPPEPPPVLTDDTLWAQLPITVGNQDLESVIVPLRRAPRVSGRLVFEGTSEPPDRATVAALGITLTPADGSPPSGGLDQVSGHAADDNAFTMPGVPPGRYVLGLAGPLPRGWMLKYAMYQGRDVADAPLELTGDDVSGVVVTFTDRPATVAGVVRADARSGGDGLVLLYPVESETWTAGGGLRRMRDARPAEDGTFSIANVPAGEYYAVAIADDVAEWPDEAKLEALARSASRVRVIDGERTTVSLQPVAVR